MKILILAGGLSPEREVSLVSASQIAKALIRKGNQVFILDLYHGIDDVKDISFTNNPDEIKEYWINNEAPDIKNMPDNISGIGKNVIEACKTADAVFIALHGDIGENGKVQAVLDINKIKYTGSGYAGCMLAMDKNISKILVSAYNIKTAKWCINSKDASIAFPCVVKPLGCGSSIGVSIAENMKELDAAVNIARNYGSDVLIEEKINGREFSVGIFDDKPLPVIEIIPKNNEFYNYKNKYQPDSTNEICPADIPLHLTEALQKTALKIHTLLQLKFYSRIDFMVDQKNNIYFLEANALPGMTPTSLLPQEAAANGISYESLCTKIAENAL